MLNKLVFLIFIPIHLSNAYSQTDDSTFVYRELDEFIVDRFFQKHYLLEVQRMRRVYPMALKAKAIIDEYEDEIQQLDSKRAQKRYSKKMNKFLKEEFSYSIRDLYTSEGRLLIQLIHRETGYTVNEILSLYATNMQAFTYRRLANLFQHDLDAKYNPNTTNKMTEIVLNDIFTEKIVFDRTMEKMEKEAFKKSKRNYKQAKATAARQKKSAKKKNP